MEERTLKENGRKIKLKRMQSGETDALEETNETEEGEEAEISLEFGEIDEDLAGLSPEETEELLKKREKAREEARKERDKLLEEGERLLRAKKYEEGEPFFAQALLYDPDERRSQEGLWVCRTRNFTADEAFFDLKSAQEFSNLSEGTKRLVLSKMGEGLKAERAALSSEREAIEGKFLAAQRARRKSFSENRNYYLVRSLIFLGAFLLLLVGALVSVYFIPRTKTDLPIILTIAFGAAALLSLLIGVIFLRGLYGALRLCRENEKLSSTEDGARLKEVRERLECLSLVLGEEERSENES